MSNIETAKAGLKAIAIGEARGAASITVYALACLSLVAADTFSADDAPTLYSDRFGWLNGERRELGKDPVKAPEGKSLAAQVAKFRAFMDLGAVARTRPDVSETIATVAQSVGSNYKRTLAAASKMRAVLAKDPDVDPVELLGEASAASDVSEADAPKATTAFDKMATLFETMQSDFPGIFASVAKGKAPTITADMSAMLSKFGKQIALAQAIVEAEG